MSTAGLPIACKRFLRPLNRLWWPFPTDAADAAQVPASTARSSSWTFLDLLHHDLLWEDTYGTQGERAR